ncbi:Signal recognition particle receptor domain containing protein [Aphelenchoides fujianensis]|nr:Signal recognition particle receptor domain containing protein [Aphelenchoides fujianensis]
MGAKSKYVLVQLKSIVSGSTKVWLRERAAAKAAQVLFDPAVGDKVLFEEHDTIKGKTDLRWNNVPLLVWSSLIVFAVALLTYFVFFGRKKRTNVLLVGLSDAGKTAIFTRFVSRGVDWELYKSLAENVVQVAGASGETLQLIDYPGSERLRSRLFEHWLGREIRQLRRVLFVVDGATFAKKSRDIAELLYDVLVATRGAKMPVMIACNKQDAPTAKNSEAVRSQLEKELGLVSKTRESTLESTSDTQQRVILGRGGEFRWEADAPNVHFIDCTATEAESVAELREWAL